ncbi:hypothetical protein T265_03655 [Opisthorchis viverrini]|uniref:Uncharacterized protein n=1 Tax=Opisthorchis viverrini TaxID=6198 RepID=A0A074ZQQ9_OPIVI|nr:hypothetical protein T265_03655 [Opisthorchis viverrini]KER29743.1 hypothetical protein T265_03655 [Opisthorchis viverrini]
MSRPSEAHSVAWKHHKREIQLGSRRKHEGFDTARLPEPRQGESRGRGRIRTTDLPASDSPLDYRRLRVIIIL